LITAATGGDKAHAAILLTLSALDANVIEGASMLIPYIRAKMNAQGEITDPATEKALRSVVDALVKSLRS
jgi:chromate reductase